MGAVLSISGWALATDAFLQIHPASGNEPLRSTTSEANLTVDDLQQRLELINGQISSLIFRQRHVPLLLNPTLTLRLTLVTLT